jgi:hypothetical protein
VDRARGSGWSWQDIAGRLGVSQADRPPQARAQGSGDAMRNQRFGDDARALVRTAQEHARVLGHSGIGSEHLLYAVADSPTRVGAAAREHGLTPDGVLAQTDRLLARPRRVFAGLDAEALAAIGIDLDAVRAAVEANFGPAQGSSTWARRHRVRLPGHLPVSGRAPSCIQAAMREAGGAAQVATHHLDAIQAQRPKRVTPTRSAGGYPSDHDVAHRKRITGTHLDNNSACRAAPAVRRSRTSLHDAIPARLHLPAAGRSPFSTSAASATCQSAPRPLRPPRRRRARSVGGAEAVVLPLGFVELVFECDDAAATSSPRSRPGTTSWRPPAGRCVSPTRRSAS